MTDDIVARRATVRGRVQGVFFRDSTRRRARELGVAGWVRNEPDGTVTIVAQGPEEAVDELVAWAHDGPPHARVADVEVDVTEDEVTDRTSFEVRHAR